MMNLLREKNYALLLVAATLVAGGLIFAAMFIYSVPYIWYDDYLSALGRTRLSDGTSNLLAAFLFNTALIIAGIFSGSYVCMRGVFCGNRFLAVLLWFSGSVGGLALAGIGATPYNLAPHTHNMCTFFASLGLGISVFLCSMSRGNRMSGAAENLQWALMTLYFGLVWTAWAYVRAKKLVPNSPTGEIMQKMMVSLFYLYMLWNSVLCYRRCRQEKSNDAA